MIYGFIGLGNMGGAIVRGMTAKGRPEGDKIAGYNRSFTKTERLMGECGLSPMESIEDLAAGADVIVLAVKPQMFHEVIPEVLRGIRKRQDRQSPLVVSIAAGKTLEYLEEAFGNKTPIVRAMPNINAVVGASVTAICPNRACTGEQISVVKDMFSAIGGVYEIEERFFAAFSAIAGCSPAFTDLYINALADGALRLGMPKDLALQIAAEAVLGSAKMVLRGKEHPAALMDRVCSPGGTTIEGVLKLKEQGFESAVHQAVDAVVQKDLKLR